MKRRYAIYDVFTSRPLTGNPLAVVFDGEGLDSVSMQAIAGEFNLSETIFVLPASRPAHSAAVRIFTPRCELPFAGHPTIGCAVALVEEGLAGTRDTESILVLEELIGPVRCGVRSNGGIGFGEFDLPRLPDEIPRTLPAPVIAEALGLDPVDIGFENHRCGLWSAGLAYVTVPVRGMAAAARVSMNVEAWLQAMEPVDGHVPAPYVYCRETLNHDCGFHARMFAPFDGIAEDPATGSAAAAFAGAIHRHDSPVDGPHPVWIEQGIEMGRPSKIRLELDIGNGVIGAVRIAGNAIRIADGHLMV